MSWLGYLPWSEGIKKRACRYLLQRYLGQFLEEKLTLDQLTVDLYNGTGRVTNVSLDVQALNELGDQQHLPLEFVDGFVAEMSVSIPWSALLSDASYVEVTGLKLTMQPTKRSETGASMFESMWSSMTSSMQLAQECLQQDATSGGNSQPLEGIELFAQTIDSILCRVKIRFLDTVIRLEHVPLDSTTGVAIEICIQNLEYSDEAGSDPCHSSLDPNQSTKGYVVSAFTTKCFYLEGVTFHTDEFPSGARTFSKSVISTSRGSTPDSKNSDGQFCSAQISPTQNMQTPPEKSMINNLNESNPIPFAKLFAGQEIRLKLKQGEGIVGPKVELLVTLGALTSFLSPRQVHVLLELIHGLASPDMEDVSNVAPRSTCTEKPMAKCDFNRVERELLNQINPLQGLRTMDLRHTQGWSTASLDDSDNEEEFLPMRAPGCTLMNNSISCNNSSVEDSFTETSNSLKNSFSSESKQHKCRNSIETDPSAETSQFYIRISSLAIILLHENILTIGMEGCGPTKASTKMMISMSDDFFKKLGLFGVSGYGYKDFEKSNKIIADACQHSHLRVLAAPLVVEGSEKTTTKYSAISGNLTLANLEFVECLIDNNVCSSQRSNSTVLIELLIFPKENTVNTNFSNNADFKMDFNCTEKAVRQGQMTKYVHPHRELEITLAECEVEFDISIIDRISTLLNSQPICMSTRATAATRENINQTTLFYQAVESPSLPDSRLRIKVNSSKCKINLRFPIPDLRPLHDMNRIPWWKRSVRPDYVSFRVTDAKLNSLFESNTPYLARLEIQCRYLLITYTEADSDVPLKIAKASADGCRNDESLQNEDEGFGWPRVVLTIFPLNVGGPLEDSSEGEPESSLDDPLENPPRHQPSPFSSKRIIHESDTPHSQSYTTKDKDGKEQRNGEEIIIPGNRQEMLEFIEEGTRNCRIQLEIALPCTSIQIPSKHLYELIYNRFNTDLFLWESSAPRPKYMSNVEPIAGIDLASTLLQESIYPKFSMCKSCIQYDSDSDSEEEGIFNSTASRTVKHKHIRVLKYKQSKVALTLTINQGLLTMYTPVRDSMKNVIPGQQGEIILRLDDLIVFSVSSYKGDEKLGFVCLMSKDVALYHCGLITMPSKTPPLRSINTIIPKYCQRSIYKSEPGAYASMNVAEKDMLSVAIRIQAAHETHRIKTFRVAIGINHATLKYRACSSQTFWLTQLTDCLDVIDHPVVGYLPPGILTELHVHLWNCAVDYRPLYLPLRSMVTLGNFSVSSNIAAQTNTSTLRFIAEDVALFISDKINKAVDLRRDYVCVMDFGLFELSLRLNEKMCGGAPQIDLRASNNVLHVRTCSDSGRALMQLLTYFASDGDLALNSGSTESITVPSSEDGESLLGDESINLLSKSQAERVNSLMEEAMKDTIKESVNSVERKPPEKDNKIEVFFFPDESSPTVTKESMQCDKELTINHGNTISDRQIDFDDADEDFCILGEEAGVGIIPRHGVPEVRWLSQESLRIVDNHFSLPSGKTDLLKSPKNFPPAILRYTLCEMTLVWHMYGGKDFCDTHLSTKKQLGTNDNYASAYSQVRSRSAIDAIGYSKSSPNKVRFGSMPNSPHTHSRDNAMSWIELGGPGRRQDIRMELQLSKVRFRHEIYPENTHEAGCQILLISEIEVRDRLASSHINKFLYQYSSEANPRQSHANMFALKAVHVRPDPRFAAQECCLKLSLLPLRLNVDQDSLLFLVDFFTDLGDGSRQCPESSTAPSSMQSSPGSKQGTPTHHPPVMSVNDQFEETRAKNAMNSSQNANVDQNLMILLEDELTIKESKARTRTVVETPENSQPVYFRSVTFGPEVLVRLDYHGKRVDLTHGPLAGLLMGLAQLNCSELRLKRLSHRHGLLGFDKLIAYLIGEWIQDIKKNQLPSLLGGVGPMYSLVQLFQGIRDLFWLPIEQYQKDGRIVRGLQRGANSFTTSTAMAALELTSRLVHAIQSTAEMAYDMVSPGPSFRCHVEGRKGRRKRYNQPFDIREGMANAYVLVKEGLGETANQLVRVASEEHEQKGVSGAVGGVLRQIPPTVVKPIILATEATNNVLGGMRSQLVPDARKEAVQKWRQDDVSN